MLELDEGSAPPEGVLEVLAALLEEQAKVARVEVALAAAKERLAALQDRYRALGGVVPEPGDAWPSLLSERQARCGRVVHEGGCSMRSRILAEMEARAGEILTPAQLAPLVEARSRDAVRNALLVLAEKGKIEKVGLGQYRVACAAS